MMSWARPVRSISSLLVGSALLAATLTPTMAGERHRDRIYADSYGNLVIYSRAGYKRIIVGQGHLAGELSDYTSAGDGPKVVRADEDYGYSPCYRPPVLWKGRSYMYGFDEGEMPQPSGSCYNR
jgi:hypothetical protein